MRLKLSEWAERNYSDNSRPHHTTLRRMAADGEIDGAFQTTTGRWYVEIDQQGVSTDDLMRKVIGDDPELLKVMGL